MILVLAIRGNVLGISNCTVGNLQWCSYRERVCPSLDWKVMPAFGVQAASRTASLESHLNAVSWLTQDIQQRILKMLSREKERIRKPWGQDPSQVSFIIIYYPKVGDRNKNNDSKTLNSYFSLGVKRHTYANTHIPTHIHPDQTVQPMCIILPES